MKNLFGIKFQIASLLLALFLVQIAHAQNISPENDLGKFVNKYLERINSAKKDDGGNSPSSVQERFFTGQSPNDFFGYSISTAGDVNADGFSDIIIGSYGSDDFGNNTGRAYLFFGGTAVSSTPNLILTGEAGNDFFGYSVSTAGDVNGDGYDDVIVGAYGNDEQGNNSGSVYVFLGGSNMNNVYDYKFSGVTSGEQFGISVSDAGDVNGDGFADVIVGANGINEGRAYLYFGGITMSNEPSVTFNGYGDNDQFGFSTSGCGDLNGDGFSDIIIGAPLNDDAAKDAGSAYIYFGGAVMDNIPDALLTGALSNDFFGSSVSIVGDINSDGYSDAVVGAYANDDHGANSGKVYIYLGGENMNSSPTLSISGIIAGDQFGYAVSRAGDVNGDGFGDFIVGATGQDAGGISSGRAYIYFGSVQPDNVPDIILTGKTSGDNFGTSVSTVGDINGDGYADVIIGASNNDAGGSNAGRVYLYSNSSTGTDMPDEIFTGLSNDDQFGYSVSEAGDVNGDGYPDLIVGAPFNDEFKADAGSAYIFFGGPLMDNLPDIYLTGATAGDLFGISVSDAGDVNGDGFGDVIVGASSNDQHGIDAGRAYIYFGGHPMNNIVDVILTGEAAYDWFGFSVSKAGDVNGDGFGDVIVGAYLNDIPGGSGGRAYIYYGGAVMDSTKDVVLNATGGGDYFGYSVSDAGDVNKDGFDDVIVGAYLNDDGGGGSGKAYIYYGGTNMNNVPDVAFGGTENNDNLGYSVSGAGDVNGDGFDDVIVGVPGNDAAGFSAGRANIYFGGSKMDNIADVILPGLAAGDLFGTSVSDAGDINADGYKDVLVGANSNDAGGTDAGRAYVYYGAYSMDSSPDIIFTGEAANDFFGTSVSSAGDVNKDGYDDVFIGAFYNDAFATNAGRAYLYLSSTPPVKPRIVFIKDVPNDQGGFVNINFVRSGLDIKGVNKIKSYLIERSEPAGNNGFFWNQVGTVVPVQNQQYGYRAATPYDYSSNSSGISFYRVTAQTNNPDEYWHSNIVGGQSLDNLSPERPSNLTIQLGQYAVHLSWISNSESDLKEYQVYKSNTYPTPNPLYIGSTTYPSFYDSSAATAYYLVRAVDIHDNKSSFAVDSLTVVGIKDEIVPIKNELLQNYPNPWNPSTVIRYGLTEKSLVNLSIFNTIGEEIAVLVNKEQEQGYYNVEFNGENLPSGVYIYKLITKDFISSQKMLLIK